MAENIKVSYNYLNPHEEYYAKFKTRNTFNKYTDNMFQQASLRGELDIMEHTLDTIQQKTDTGEFDIDKLASDFRFDLLSEETAENVIYNELYGDREKLVDYEEEVWDANKAKYETIKYNISEYDLNRKLFKDRVNYEVEQDNIRRAEETKKNRNGFEKAVSAIGDFIVGVPMEMFYGIVDITADTLAFVEGAGRWIAGGFSAEEFQKAYIKNDALLSAWRDMGWMQEMQKWQGEWGYIRDTQGNYTDYGQFVGGIAYSIGQMLPSIAISAATAGTGGALTAAAKGASGAAKVGLKIAAYSVNHLSEAIYYTGLTSGTFREMVNNPELANVSASKKMLNAAARGAAEWAVQGALNRCFGASMMDKAVFGYKSANKAIGKVGALQALKVIGIDALHEGLEEMLQQYSNYVVDNFFALGDDNYVATSDWNLKTMLSAFAMGAISSIATSTFSVIKRGAKNRIDRQVESKRIQNAIKNDVYTQLSSIDTNITSLNNQLDNGVSPERYTQIQDELKTLNQQKTDLQKQYKLDKNTRMVFQDGKIVDNTPKMNALASWNYQSTLKDLYQQYNDLIQDTSLTDSERNQAVGQMMVTMNTLASMFTNVGSENVAKAQKLLTDIQAKALANKGLTLNEDGSLTLSKDTAEYKLSKQETITGEQAKYRSEMVGKEAYDAMATTIMQTLDNIKADYVQHIVEGLPIESQKEVAKQAEKLTKKKRKRKVEPQTNEQVTEDAVEMAKVVKDDLGVDNIELIADGPESVNAVATVAAKVEREVRHLPEGANAAAVNRITTLCQEFNITLDDFNSLPTDVQQTVIKKNLATGRKALKDFYTKDYVKQTANNQAKVETPVKVEAPAKAHVVATETDAQAVIDEVKRTIVSEPVQALTEANELMTVAKAIADLALPTALATNPKYRILFKELYFVAQQIDPTIANVDQAMAQLLMNDEFIHNMVWSSSEQMYEFMGSLEFIVKAAVGKGAVETAIQTRLNRTFDVIKHELMEYSIAVKDARPELLSVFNADEVREIRRKRFGRDFTSALMNVKSDIKIEYTLDGDKIAIIVTGDSKYTHLGTVLSSAINSLNTYGKQACIQAIQNYVSDASVLNKANLAETLGTYIGQFSDVYHDGTYFQMDEAQGVIANTFMQKNGIDRHTFRDIARCKQLSNDAQIQQIAKTIFGNSFEFALNDNKKLLSQVFVVFAKMFNQQTNGIYAFKLGYYEYNFAEGIPPKHYLDQNPYSFVVTRVNTTSEQVFKAMFNNDFSLRNLSQQQEGGIFYVVNNHIERTVNGKTENMPILKAFDNAETTLLADSVTDIAAEGLTVNDLITQVNVDENGQYTSLLLSDKVQEQIRARYGNVSPDAIFAYLRKFFIANSDGRYGIVMDQKGRVNVVNVKSITDTFRADINEKLKTVTAKDLVRQTYSLSDIMNEQYMSKELEGYTITFTPRDINGAFGEIDGKLIKIFVDDTMSANEIKYNIAHEIKHAIQDTLGLTPGFSIGMILDRTVKNGQASYQWVAEHNRGVDRNVVNDFVKDIKTYLNYDGSIDWYRRQLGDSIVDKAKYDSTDNYNTFVLDALLLSRFVYLTSGELEAYGTSLSMINGQYYASFTPTQIVNTRDTLAVTAPWGKTYKLMNPKGMKAAGRDMNAGIIKASQDINSEIDSMMSIDMTDDTLLSYNFMVVSQDGDIKVDHQYDSVVDLVNKVRNKSETSDNFMTDSTIYIENVSGDGSTKFNINIGNQNFSQSRYDGIVRAINLLVQGGADVHITVPFTGLDIDVTVNSEFSPQDALLAVGIGSPDPDKQFFKKMSQNVDPETPASKEFEKTVKANKKQSDKRHENKGVKTDSPRTTRTNDTFVSKKWLQENGLENTGARFFAGKQRNNSIIRLASEVDFARVAPELSEAIQDGSLTLHELYKLIRRGDILDPNRSTSQYTLEILNDTIFHNPYIDTPQMLDNISQVSLADYYALRRIIMMGDGKYLLDQVLQSTEFEFFAEKYRNDPKFKEQYQQFIEQFHKEYRSENGGSYRVDYGTLRLRALQQFDGTIQSGYNIAKSEIFAAKHGFARNDIQNQESLERNVGSLKGGEEGGDMTLHDVIEKRNALWDVFNSMDLDDITDRIAFITDAEEALVEWYIENDFNRRADKIKWRSADAIARAQDAYVYGRLDKDGNLVEGVTQKLEKRQKAMGSSEYVNWLIDQIAQKAYDFMPEELRSTDVSKHGGEYVSRKPKNVKAYISVVAKRINERMSVKSEYAKRAFLKRYGEYFNDDLTLKGNYYMGKNVPSNMERYIETRNLLSQISKEVNGGRFDHGETSVKEYDRRQRENNQRKEAKMQKMVSQERYQRVKTKLDEERRKHVQEFSVGKNNVSIVGDAVIPESFKSIMNATYERFAETEVKYLATEGEMHVVQSVKEFTNANAETFANMSAQDIQELATFLVENQVFSDNDEATYRAQFYRILTIVQLEAMNSDFDNVILNKDTVLKMDQVIKLWEQRAGRDLTGARDIAKKLKPFKQILSDLTSKAGYKFTEDEQIRVDKQLDKVYMAIRKDATRSTKETLAEIQTQAKAYYDLLLDIDSKHGRKGIDNFVDKLWKFQRMAMLSSPGTWGRNYVSNTVVMITNKAADGLGHLIFDKIGKAKQIEGQYRMDAKPTQQVKEYIQREFFTIVEDEHGKKVTLYDLLSDGLNKWSPTTDSKFDIDEALSEVPLYADTDRRIRERTTVSYKAYSTVLTQMIARSIQSKLFMEHQFGHSKAGEVMNKISKVLFTVLSDDPFIKHQTNVYFAKILQESIIDGRIDPKGLTQGTNTELENRTRLQVLKLFSEAYGLAAFDYMRRQNFINKLEIQLSGHSKYFMALWKQIMPFASAGWNWFLEGTKYTPIGLVAGIVKYARLEKRIAKAQADYKLGKYQGPDIKFMQFLAKRDVGKGIIGTLGFAFGAFLAGMGWLSIDDEDDKMKLTLGDVKIDISDVFGTSGLLAGAAIMSGAKDKIGIWKTLIRATDIFLEDSLFNDMFTTFTRGDTIGETVLNMPFDKLSAFVPNIVKSVIKLTYTHKPQYSSGFMGKLERWGVQNIPGIVYALPKRYDPYTGEYQLAYAGGPFLAWLQKFSSVIGVKIYQYDVTDLELQARSLGVTRGELSCNYKDIAPFDSKQKAMANQLYGEWNKRDLDKFYSNKTKYRIQMEDGTYKELRYKDMTNTQRKAVTERIMSDNSNLAKIYVYTQVIGSKYYASESEYEKLRKAGIKTNIYKENKKKKLTGFM